MTLASLTLRIGTRGSKLALWQSNHIRDRLLALGVGAVELVIIKTTGDRIQDVALSQVGGKGLFVKEIEEALLAHEVDLAVHSMKDMPSELPAGLALTCVPERASPLDAWCLPHGRKAPADFLAALPDGAVIGTSSLRRVVQLRARRPDLRFIPLRGNVDTRLRKLDEGEDDLAAIVLACAGLDRLGLGDRISARIPDDLMIPAVGQGALALESRADDAVVNPILAQLEDAQTRTTTTAERAFLARLEGNCQVPIAAHARLEGDALTLTGLFADTHEHVSISKISGNRDNPHLLGEALADALRADLEARLP
jgi:hydroxymethylbilane synthase